MNILNLVLCDEFWENSLNRGKEMLKNPVMLPITAQCLHLFLFRETVWRGVKRQQHENDPSLSDCQRINGSFIFHGENIKLFFNEEEQNDFRLNHQPKKKKKTI